jgi:hypothetical protein
MRLPPIKLGFKKLSDEEKWSHEHVVYRTHVVEDIIWSMHNKYLGEVPIKSCDIFNTIHPFFLSERVHIHMRRECVYTLSEANHIYSFEVLRELEKPPMEKPENWIIFIDSLCGDEKAHE